MKLRIVSDGTPVGTKVLTEDGRDISAAVLSCSWALGATDGIAKVQLEVLADVELAGEITTEDILTHFWPARVAR
jgi:hypothetical protein